MPPKEIQFYHGHVADVIQPIFVGGLIASAFTLSQYRRANLAVIVKGNDTPSVIMIWALGFLQILHLSFAFNAWIQYSNEMLADALNFHWLLSGMFLTNIAMVITSLSFVAYVAHNVYTPRLKYALWIIPVIVGGANLVPIFFPGSNADTLGAYNATVMAFVIFSSVAILPFCSLLSQIDSSGPHPPGYYRTIVMISLFVSYLSVIQAIWHILNLVSSAVATFTATYAGTLIMIFLSEIAGMLYPAVVLFAVASFGMPQPYYVSTFERGVLVEVNV